MEMEIDEEMPSADLSRRSLERKQSFSLVDFDQGKIERHDVVAWGSCHNGELGLGDAIDIKEELLSIPSTLPKFSDAKVVKIACGESHTLLILNDGSLWSSGANDQGQLGHDKQSSRRPEQVEGLNGRFIVDVCAGVAQSFAIDKWGEIFAWGSDSHGQLGLGSVYENERSVKRPKMIKALASKVVVQVACGNFHTVMLTNAGEVYTCGSNSHGQLGLGIANGPNQHKPTLVELLAGFPIASIAAGGFHCFVLSKSSTVFGWGRNNSGQLGVGDTADKCQPTQLSTLRSLVVRYITAGSSHSVFLTNDGGVFTCGSGANGQLGHSSFSDEVLPRKILEFGSIVTQVACGLYHTLCVTNGKLYAFGLGSSGQLGSSQSSQKSPMLVMNLKSGVYAVYAGGNQSFVLSSGETSPTNTTPCDPSLDYRKSNEIKRIAEITPDLVQQMCTAGEPVDQDLMTLVETVFASSSCWNSSFLFANSITPCTYKYIGVDLRMAGEVLSKLKDMKTESLRDLLNVTLENNLLPKLPHQLMCVEILRVYVLLPLTPTFYNGINDVLQVYFAERVLRLPRQLQTVVFLWLYFSPIDHLTRLISVYKRLIVHIIDSDPQQQNVSKSSGLRNALMFLEQLYVINRQNQRLSYHSFYIPQLVQKVDIRQDYTTYLTIKQHPVDRKLCFCEFPFVFDSQAKTLLLQYDHMKEWKDAMHVARNQLILNNPLAAFLPPSNEMEARVVFLNLTVRRNNIVQDTINQMYNLTTVDLKKPLRVKFVGEDAEDAGGVKKEFFMLIIREILDPKYGMFRHYDDSRQIWFDGATFEDDNSLFFIIGLLCGLAIYNLIIINLPFPLALYKKLLGEKVDLNDLKDLSPMVARGLEQLLAYKEEDFTDVFCLNFEICVERYGHVTTVPLKPNGEKIAVTQENKQEYVDAYVSYVLNTSVDKQFGAFKDGFQRVCTSNVLHLFHAQELQAMVIGNEDYDWGELERNCTYKGVYSHVHPTIIMFWEVFHELSVEEKKKFLLFLTGSDRVPILGMGTIRITIQPTNDDRFLPVAHTCFNLLDLPMYQTKEKTRYKLLQAIGHTQGFTLV